jgi:hypothetical protein
MEFEIGLIYSIGGVTCLGLSVARRRFYYEFSIFFEFSGFYFSQWLIFGSYFGGD